eukprot:5179132-Alexandrium_andersonii.AAC.1
MPTNDPSGGSSVGRASQRAPNLREHGCSRDCFRLAGSRPQVCPELGPVLRSPVASRERCGSQ